MAAASRLLLGIDKSVHAKPLPVSAVVYETTCYTWVTPTKSISLHAEPPMLSIPPFSSSIFEKLTSELNNKGNDLILEMLAWDKWGQQSPQDLVSTQSLVKDRKGQRPSEVSGVVVVPFGRESQKEQFSLWNQRKTELSPHTTVTLHRVAPSSKRLAFTRTNWLVRKYHIQIHSF